MVKRFLAASALTVIAAVAPAGAVLADPIPDEPGCTVYVSAQPVPVSAYCDPYDYNSTHVTPYISVNQG